MLEKRMKSHKPMFAKMTTLGTLDSKERKVIVQLSQIRAVHSPSREVELINDDVYMLTEKSLEELSKTLLQNYYLD
jgi:hypothetical protein